MNRSFRDGIRPLAGRILNLAVPLACLLPMQATAIVEITQGEGGDTPTGDPLDSNDCGSGGGSGERYQHDPRWPEVTNRQAPGIRFGGHRVLLIPVVQGGVLTFRLVFVEEPVVAPEAADAR